MIFEYVNKAAKYAIDILYLFFKDCGMEDEFMDMDELNRRAEVLKVLSHPQRLCIIRGINTYHCNVGKIQETLGLSQSGLSQHLSKLRAAGIIKGVRNGKEICYQVIDEKVLRIVDMMFEGLE